MKLKRALSLFMTAIFLSSSMPLNAFAEDISVDESTIVAADTTASGSALSVISPEIDVDFNITGQWDGGFNGEITIKNVSDKLIENWQIKMQFPQELTNIWNANILSHEDDMYIIKNAGYNNNINIPAGESVSFGFGGTYDNEIIEPSNIELLLSPDTAKKNNYDIEYQVMSDWGSGYTAQIIITNNTDVAMEGWHLNFDYARKIDSIWNAAVESSEGESYTVSNAGYNSVIPAKGSVSFGFVGNGGNISDTPQNYELILNSTTDETLVPEIIVDEDSLGDYKTIADSYIISDEITSVSGELKNKKSFKELYYIISSRSGEEIDRKNIEINSNWTIEDIDLKNKTLAIVGITKDDTAILKMVVYIDPEYDYKDNDDDGLVNIFEDCYNTDKENADSDGDKLPDGYEVWYLNTSPILGDTDGNEISDADEDFDTDGLTNLEEFNRATLPLSADTDGDALIDGDEVNKYGTDPVLPDTDGDTLNDNDELKLSFDPLVKDTDDNGIDDNDEIITQTFTQIIDNDEKKAVTSVSVTLACKGNIENSVSIEDMYNKDILSSGVVGLVGVPVEIKCEQTFDTAEIKFTYDESQLGDTSEDDLAVMWYDEVNNKYVLLDESVIDKENNTASYVTTHFSTYLLVDRKVWLDAWRRDTPTTPIETYYDVAFVLDVSGSMNGTRINKAKTAICTFIKALSDKDRGAIISFNHNSYLEAGLTSDREVLLSAAENAALKTASHGGTNTDKGLYTGLLQLKNADNASNHKQIVIMICDGDVKYVQSTIDIAKNNNIAVYTVNVVNSSNGYLEKIASETNGEYYYAATSNELGIVLDDIQNTIVSDDSDGDGLKDIWETGGMQIPNGLRVYSNPKDKNTDTDALDDGVEMGPYDEENDYFPEYHSNPQDEDTDDDTLLDHADPAPRYPFDTRFKIVDDFNYVPKIDFVERHVKRGEQCYSTISSTVPDFLPYIGLVTLADLGVSTNGMSVLHFPQVENDTLYNSKHFSSFLDHYIDGNGTTYHINSEDMAQIIFSQKRNIEHFENNKYSIQKAAEELCANGNTIYIATAGTNDFKSTCYKKQSCSHADNSIIYYDNVIALDWGYSIGEALCGMVAKVDYRDDCYFMDLKYYLIDTYEFPVHWSIADSKSALDINAHNLHERGLAREYIIIGEYDQTIAWKKGTLDEPKPKITVFSNDYNNDPIS